MIEIIIKCVICTYLYNVYDGVSNISITFPTQKLSIYRYILINDLASS